MIKFENGELVKSAHVVINGIEYPVIMPEYSGNTPLSAENMNRLQEEASVPIGSVFEYAGLTAPADYLLCDGSEVSREEYKDLFNVIKDTYGAGDRYTTFNLPNMKGRVAVGRDENDSDFMILGDAGGSKYLQEHSHKTTTDDGAVALSNTTSNANAFSASGNANYRRNISLSTNITGTAGTGNSENLQPYLVMNYIIKAKNGSSNIGLELDEVNGEVI